MNMRLQRFDSTFLRDFMEPIAINTAVLPEVEPEAPPPPPPPVYGEAEMEHAREASRKIGYAEGFEAGLAQAHTEDTTRQKDTLQVLAHISDQLATLAGSYQQLVSRQTAELSELVLLIARKVAGAALDTRGVAATQDLLARCLPVIFAKPRVVIELSQPMLELAEPALANQLAQAGYVGDAIFRVGEGLELHDMRVIWDQGQANRSVEAIWQEIAVLLQQVPLEPTVETTLPSSTETEIITGATHE